MSGKAKVKTNAVRILDSHKIEHEVYTYDTKDGVIDGQGVAAKLNQNPNQVFKTLVTQGKSKEYYVFVVPVAGELDFKKAEKATGEKKIEMIPMKDLLKVSGYIHGGCSCIGMKKQFKTYIDKSALDFDSFMFSGGKIGVQIKMKAEALKDIIPVEFVDLKKNYNE